MIHFFKKYLFVILLVLNSCAPPSADYVDQDFVPRRDVLATSLYTQGQRLLKSGRFIDAEISFRKAAYLFPEAENIQSQLALTLKSAGLYKESIELYRSLIQRNPKMIDYQFALADALYKSGRFTEAIESFEKTKLAFESKKELSKAANTARSMAAVYYEIGKEDLALCYSEEAHTYSPILPEVQRHARLLVALGYFKKADTYLAPFVSDPTVVADPFILKIASFAKFGLGLIDEFDKLVSRAEQVKLAGTDLDLEMQAMVAIYERHAIEKDQQEEEQEEQEEEKVLPTLNDGVLLYWPASLIESWKTLLESNIENQ